MVTGYITYQKYFKHSNYPPPGAREGAVAIVLVLLPARRQRPAGNPYVVLGIAVEGPAESLCVPLVAGRAEDPHRRQHRPQPQVGAGGEHHLVLPALVHADDLEPLGQPGCQFNGILIFGPFFGCIFGALFALNSMAF